MRIVSGLTVPQIARAFLVGESAMEQRITRAKSRIAKAEVPFETPGPIERAERLAAVAAMIYLLFNEGYSASGGDDGAAMRQPLAEEAIRLARLLLRLYPGEPEIMGLTALMLLQHSRVSARFDAEGALVLLDDQDRRLWNRPLIAEGLALIDKAMRHARTGPYQVQAAIAALHAGRAARQVRRAEIDLLYQTLERLQPSPVVTLNRAVAVSKLPHAEAALAMIDRWRPGSAAISTSSASRALCSARPQGGGAGRLRRGHCARQHRRRGGASTASRPADAGQHHGRGSASYCGSANAGATVRRQMGFVGGAGAEARGLEALPEPGREGPLGQDDDISPAHEVASGQQILHPMASRWIPI